MMTENDVELWAARISAEKSQKLHEAMSEGGELHTSYIRTKQELVEHALDNLLKSLNSENSSAAAHA